MMQLTIAIHCLKMSLVDYAIYSDRYFMLSKSLIGPKQENPVCPLREDRC